MIYCYPYHHNSIPKRYPRARSASSLLYQIQDLHRHIPFVIEFSSITTFLPYWLTCILSIPNAYIRNDALIPSSWTGIRSSVVWHSVAHAEPPFPDLGRNIIVLIRCLPFAAAVLRQMACRHFSLLAVNTAAQCLPVTPQEFKDWLVRDLLKMVPFPWLVVTAIAVCDIILKRIHVSYPMAV